MKTNPLDKKEEKNIVMLCISYVLNLLRSLYNIFTLLSFKNYKKIRNNILIALLSKIFSTFTISTTSLYNLNMRRNS